MFKVILRLLAEVAFYTITMPIKIVCLLVWTISSIIGIAKDPEECIVEVKDELLLMKYILSIEGYWVKHGYILEEFELS